MGAAWLSLHLADHYDFTLDRRVSRGTRLSDHEGGYAVLPRLHGSGWQEPLGDRHITIAREHLQRPHRVKRAAIAMGPTMDNEILWKLFGRVIDASQTLEVDGDFRAKEVAAARIGSGPQDHANGARSWSGPRTTTAEPGATCVTCSPSTQQQQITRRENARPSDGPAARACIERRLCGGSATGWSRAWIASVDARVRRREIRKLPLAYYAIRRCRICSIIIRLFRSDGNPSSNFQGTAGIAGSLLLKPCWRNRIAPRCPRHGHRKVSGLRARGGVSGPGMGGLPTITLPQSTLSPEPEDRSRRPRRSDPRWRRTAHSRIRVAGEA